MEALVSVIAYLAQVAGTVALAAAGVFVCLAATRGPFRGASRFWRFLLLLLAVETVVVACLYVRPVVTCSAHIPFTMRQQRAWLVEKMVTQFRGFYSARLRLLAFHVRVIRLEEDCVEAEIRYLWLGSVVASYHAEYGYNIVRPLGP